MTKEEATILAAAATRLEVDERVDERFETEVVTEEGVDEGNAW